MTQARTILVSVNFSVAEKRMLACRARAAGQTLDAYIRERVIAESGCAQQVFGFLAEELAQSGEKAEQAIAELEAHSAQGSDESWESREAKRARIVNELRGSFTQPEFNALTSIFESALDAREGVGPVKGSDLKGQEKY